MTFPVGVETVTVQIGPAFSVFGTETKLTTTIRPVFGTSNRIVWEATGQTFHRLPDTQAGTGVLEFELPVVDQAGWLDGSGDEITMWAYQAVTVATDPTDRRNTVEWRQLFQPLTADAPTFVLDTEPDGTAVDTVILDREVLSVAGLTGTITKAGLLEAIDTELNNAIATTVYDVTPTGVAVTDTANIVAASTAVLADGRTHIRMAPGYYDLDGIRPEDIGGCFLLGDGVTVSDTSWVYPFSTEDWTGATAAKNRGTGTHGRIAFEFDDGQPSHYTHLFRHLKSLGVTCAFGWHTANGAQWIPEVHRHGFEIESHLPANDKATDLLTAGTLDANLEAALAAIEAEIGTRENIGFVYPQHARSAATDAIVSKYHPRGRGLESSQTYPAGLPNPWLVASYNIDAAGAAGVLTSAMKKKLREVAATNGDLVMYGHYGEGGAPAYNAMLTELVTFARGLGIKITLPGEIWPSRVVGPDPYFEDTSLWEIRPGTGAFDTAVKYHGTRSARIDPGASTTTSDIDVIEHIEIAPRPGHFTVLRASFRYYNPSPIGVAAASQGFYFNISPWYRKRDGSTPSGSGYLRCSETTLPAGDVAAQTAWTRWQELVYIGPDVTRITPRLMIANIVGGTPPFWIDELLWRHVDYVTSLRYTVTLTGTTTVYFHTGVPDLHRHNIQIVPASAPAGVLTALTPDSTNRLQIKSTNAADTMQATVIITPRGSSYESGALVSTGA